MDTQQKLYRAERAVDNADARLVLANAACADADKQVADAKVSLGDAEIAAAAALIELHEREDIAIERAEQTKAALHCANSAKSESDRALILAKFRRFNALRECAIHQVGVAKVDYSNLKRKATQAMSKLHDAQDDAEVARKHLYDAAKVAEHNLGVAGQLAEQLDEERATGSIR